MSTQIDIVDAAGVVKIADLAVEAIDVEPRLLVGADDQARSGIGGLRQIAGSSAASALAVPTGSVCPRAITVTAGAEAAMRCSMVNSRAAQPGRVMSATEMVSDSAVARMIVM
jgi:hypothetical protein